MTERRKNLGITEVVLRDAHQSLFATRLRIDDMLPIAEKLDAVGYWSLETWGGATFDACIRYLGEDPWERLRKLKKAMPNTPQQMLLRGQNILGYRHYADDVVEKFVERAAYNGIDVFRVFDAMNDVRNLQTALKAVNNVGKHAQGSISYTVSPVHTVDLWVDMGRRLEDMGAHSLCIKDMAGLLKPYVGYELVSRLKAAVNIPIHLHCHATTGLSTATYLKCIEAGVDCVDTAISSMAMTYGHSSTETLAAITENTKWDTGLDIAQLEKIAAYFREVRKKYAQFEGSLKGVDSRILVAQVPGGMLTNMENQLREQGAEDRFDEVLAEIPRVRQDLGFIPLVTPTSQIVGTQAVLNVLSGERYKNIAKETRAVVLGEYGTTPAPVNKSLLEKVQGDKQPITCRPADQLQPEFEGLKIELRKHAVDQNIQLAEGDREIDDVLTYGLFHQIGLHFLQNRDNSDAFEAAPTIHKKADATSAEAVYIVTVEGSEYAVRVADGGDVSNIVPIGISDKQATAQSGEVIHSPLAGIVLDVPVVAGQQVKQGETLMFLEAMKMETPISAPREGVVASVHVTAGAKVAVNEELLTLN